MGGPVLSLSIHRLFLRLNHAWARAIVKRASLFSLQHHDAVATRALGQCARQARSERRTGRSNPSAVGLVLDVANLLFEFFHFLRDIFQFVLDLVDLLLDAVEKVFRFGGQSYVLTGQFLRLAG
jgi:hypothetical protein